MICILRFENVYNCILDIFEVSDGVVYEILEIFDVVLLVFWFVVVYLINVKGGIVCLSKVDVSGF